MNKVKKTYAFKYDNKDILLCSSSGGAFSAISDYLLEKDAVVYGAVYDYLNNNVVHSRAVNTEERNLMRGSKYLQSRLNDIFIQIYKDLMTGKTVLFTGTSCQVAGLNRYLDTKKVDVSRLYTVDIICHGVASPLIWKEYIQEKAGKIENLNFRSKENGWEKSKAIAFSGGNVVDLKEYMRLFYSHTIQRPSCHLCPYTSTDRVSDITIGDFWGIEDIKCDFDYIDGVSFVMVNSPKGDSLFEGIGNKEYNKIQEVKIENVRQPNFYHPTKQSVIRKRLWRDYKKNGISYIVKKYASESQFYKTLVKIQKVMDSLFH